MLIGFDYTLLAALGTRPHHGKFLILLVVVALLWFWAVQFHDLAKRRFSEPNLKVIWALAVIFVPCFGPLLYALVGRDQGTRD